jgi:hypothetical protein
MPSLKYISTDPIDITLCISVSTNYSWPLFTHEIDSTALSTPELCSGSSMTAFHSLPSSQLPLVLSVHSEKDINVRKIPVN